MKDKDSKITESDELRNRKRDSNLDEFLSIKNYKSIYDFNDFQTVNHFSFDGTFSSRIYDLDRLLEKDKLREKDGFPRKIKLGKLVKPSKDGKDKTIIIPTVSEEKLYHWNSPVDGGEGQPTGGIGGEDEGDVIGEEPIRPGQEGEGQGAGQGESGEHGMGADAYDIGKILTEQFELPNIKEKGKKTSLTKFSYELTDKNKGHGQLLDKKATLKKVVKTNLSLGRLDAKKKVNTSKMLLTPSDRVYRILSKEKDYESQAVVFFIRDYSGSMQGKPTEAVVTQHIYINSWLIYQYKRQVKSRFIVHDQQAIEVPDFYTYYNKNVAGGTEVSSAYYLVNKIVEEESLSRDYNIYIFHGTDGDDWDQKGTRVIENLEKMAKFTSRIGITVAENTYTTRNNTVVERYIKESKILEKYPDIVHFDSFKAAEADETRIIKSIKLLIS
ncbi:MAG: DUF444 family protein [Ignavibacteria bacterium]|jgi:uncharacterized sporulation protein YeaH/YhbH (DUF444 family)